MIHQTPKILLAVSIAALTFTAAHANKLDAADTDGNGEIDIAEFRLHAEQKFTATDTNADGVISTEERKIARQAQRENRKAKQSEMKENSKTTRDKDTGTEGKKPESRQKKNRPNSDSDGDGVISKAEFSASVEARFAQLDQNNDGVISEDERPKRRKGPKRPQQD